LSFFSYKTLRELLFRLDPETAHTLAGFGLKMVPYSPTLLKGVKNHYFIDSPYLTQEVFGKRFLNPIGLGAGFDKNGEYVTATPALGFGFTEIGTVTPEPQKGNPKPRLFRLKEDMSIQNAMGFNNRGAEYMLNRLKSLYFLDYPIGINIGKNKITAQERAIDDYKILLEKFRDFGTYIVINISSPNTPNLRDLQNEEFIRELFKMANGVTSKPILLKIAPDMSYDSAIALCSTAIESGASGIIATNTTVDYFLTPNAKDFGGISGRLLREKSFEMFKVIGKEFYGKTTLISVGGIEDAKDIYERIKSGATLVQIYSMLIYHGPDMIRRANLELIELLKRDGYRNIAEAVGANYR
jgi:dihydroorotate dehydrogenase